MLKWKEDKLKVLWEAIARYMSGEVTCQETTQEVPLRQVRVKMRMSLE
jgi:DNA-binding transcriptional regulator YdaS (Cro superfamily)